MSIPGGKDEFNISARVDKPRVSLPYQDAIDLGRKMLISGDFNAAFGNEESSSLPLFMALSDPMSEGVLRTLSQTVHRYDPDQAESQENLQLHEFELHKPRYRTFDW